MNVPDVMDLVPHVMVVMLVNVIIHVQLIASTMMDVVFLTVQKVLGKTLIK
jgi:hypothetical protein